MKLGRTPDGKPFAFSDLPASAFPVQMTGLGPDDAVLWELTVEPYQVTEIPAAPDGLAGKVRVRVSFASGETTIQGPMSVAESHEHLRMREDT